MSEGFAALYRWVDTTLFAGYRFDAYEGEDKVALYSGKAQVGVVDAPFTWQEEGVQWLLDAWVRRLPYEHATVPRFEYEYEGMYYSVLQYEVRADVWESRAMLVGTYWRDTLVGVVYGAPVDRDDSRLADLMRWRAKQRRMPGVGVQEAARNLQAAATATAYDWGYRRPTKGEEMIGYDATVTATASTPTTYPVDTARLVLVTWEDITNDGQWRAAESLSEWAQNGAYICQNVGWLVYEDEHCIVVAARTSDGNGAIEGQSGLHERIPKSVVHSIQRMDIAGSVHYHARPIDGLDPVPGMPDFLEERQ